MKDLNFFEPYIEKTEFKIDKKLVIMVLSAIIILSLGMYIVYNSIKIKQETGMVQSLREIAEDPIALEKVKNIQTKELEVSEFRESVEKIRQLDRIIAEKDIIDESLLEIIISKMPEDLFFTSLNIHDKEIQIVGIAKDKWSIAELQKGLEDLQDSREIFISNISFQEDYYNFTINIMLGAVTEHGEEAVEEIEDQGTD